MRIKAISNRALLLIIAVIVVLSVAALLLFPANLPAAATIEIVIDGEMVELIPLMQVGAAYFHEVGSEWGENTLLIEPDGVSVSAADCPDKLCVKRGKISGGPLPIVCLPHRLTVRVINGEPPEFDAVSGQ